MKLIPLISFGLLFNASTLFCADPADPTESAKQEMLKYGANISTEVNNAVYNFKVAKKCIEKEKTEKAYGANCAGWIRDKEGRLGTSYYEKNKSDYEDAIEAAHNDQLQKLEKLAQKEIFKDKYTLSDFHAVLETLIYKKIRKKDPNTAQLTQEDPAFPDQLLFDKSDKSSIIYDLLNAKNFSTLSEKKMEKLIEISIELDKKIGKGPKNFKTIIDSRVTSNEQVYCLTPLHLAILRNSTTLVDLIIKKYKETYINEPKKIVNYVNEQVYNSIILTDAQGKYMTQNPKAPYFGLCAVKLPDNYKNRDGIYEQDPLQIAFSISSKTDPKAALDISILLLENGAEYQEDLVEARDKSKINALINKQYRPEHSSTIFNDFLMIGSNSDSKMRLNESVDKKKTILRLLVEQDKKESSRADVKERYESLIDQAVKYDNHTWCDYIINELPLIDNNASYRSGAVNYVDGYNFSRATGGQVQKSQGQEQTFIQSIFGKYNTALDVAKVNCKPILQAWALNGGQGFINVLTPNLSSDISNWNRGEKVFSILHLCGQLVKKERSVTTGQMEYVLDPSSAKAIKLLPADVSVNTIVNFIMNAQDTTGTTAWRYGLKLYFNNDEVKLRNWIESIRK